MFGRKNLKKPLTLEESIKITLERNLTLHSAVEDVVGSEFRRKEAITNFLPWWTAQYGYTRLNEAPSSSRIDIGPPLTITEVKGSRNIYAFDTTLNQPRFHWGV